MVFAEIEHLVVRPRVERRQPVAAPSFESAPEQLGQATRRLWLDRRDTANDQPCIIGDGGMPNPRTIDRGLTGHARTLLAVRMGLPIVAAGAFSIARS